MYILWFHVQRGFPYQLELPCKKKVISNQESF